MGMNEKPALSTETIVIRKARLEDAALIAEYNAGIARETEHLELEMERLLAGVKEVLRTESHGRYYLACAGDEDGKIVGQLMITYEWSDWRNGQFWWIQSVYVHADYRRRGVFRALHEHVRNAAQADEGVCGLRLYVERENERAQKTYQDLGMSETAYQVYEEDWAL